MAAEERVWLPEPGFRDWAWERKLRRLEAAMLAGDEVEIYGLQARLEKSGYEVPTTVREVRELLRWR